MVSNRLQMNSRQVGYPAVPFQSYRGSFRKFFREYVFPILPADEAVFNWHRSILTYLNDSPGLFVVRKVAPYKLRGFRYYVNGCRFVCSDNEAALWTYMECYAGASAGDFGGLIEEQAFPIAFCYKAAEKELAFWRNTGRVHSQFSKGKWKHAHVLPCGVRESGGSQPLALKTKMLRLLSPLNHFPFPSSRHFCMQKAWEENQGVLDLVTYMLARELGSRARRQEFREFVQVAGGSIPSTSPSDVEIDIEEDPTRPKRFLIPDRVKEKGDLANAPSTDESFYSLAKVPKRNAISFDELMRRLRAWLKNTDEEIICNGNARHNQTPWLWAKHGAHLLYLNADSTRQGVSAFCKMYGGRKRLRVIKNDDRRKKPSDRTINKVVVSGQSPISGFFLYSSEHFERERNL